MNTSKQQEIFFKTDAPFVGQVKGTPGRTGAGSSEPQSATQTAHRQQKHHGSQKRQLREVSGCVTTEVFERLEVLRHAGQDDEVSRSKFVGDYVTRGVRGTLDTGYVSMIKPFIEAAIERKWTEFSNRYLGLTARNTCELSKIVPMLLAFFGEVLPDTIVHKIEATGDTAARVTITERSPEVKETMQQLKEESSVF